jgi:hypothetical protein
MVSEVKGSSKTLNKSISELSQYMNNVDIEVNSELRKQMYARIAEISRWWAEEGFKAGVNETLKQLNIKKVALSEIEHEFGDAWLAPGIKQKLILSWPKRLHRRGRRA